MLGNRQGPAPAAVRVAVKRRGSELREKVRKWSTAEGSTRLSCAISTRRIGHEDTRPLRGSSGSTRKPPPLQKAMHHFGRAGRSGSISPSCETPHLPRDQREATPCIHTDSRRVLVQRVTAQATRSSASWMVHNPLLRKILFPHPCGTGWKFV